VGHEEPGTGGTFIDPAQTLRAMAQSGHGPTITHC
jgi:hypothetical protein